MLTWLPIDDQFALAEMVHPEDYDACRLIATDDSWVQTSWRLGETFMEKGVIRRVQMRVALLPRSAGSESAGRLLEHFLSEAPPLTA